ncbi:MAG TPA: CerR family C-terminal domain-containing protein [Planctomycetota bacterium]|nr:CerR family C-terminal domain-containing protein [Planctomycetota bacterium]
MTVHPDSLTQAETKQRLLDAAGEVFAEQGFRGATIRDICKRAGANVAAVNYHFGDKEKLYLAVIRYAHVCAAAKDFPPEVTEPGRLAARERLRAYVHHFLQRLLDVGRPSWHSKLMAREMIEPTAALDIIVAESIKPHYQLLLSILREYLGDGVDEPTLRMCVGSLLGQCLFHHHSRAVIQRVLPQQKYGPEEIARIAEHIAEFTHLGLTQMSAKARAGKPNV